MLVSQEDVENYNKIKSGMDRLRILVEQSELWIYKRKEINKTHSDKLKTNKNLDVEINNNNTEFKIPKIDEPTSYNLDNHESNEKVDKEIKELDEGPKLEHLAIVKYKELYKILKTMIKMCVSETTTLDGVVVKKPLKNNQRLLRNIGVHNIVLDLTKITYEKAEDKRMKIVMRVAHEFLQNFCYSNQRNQALLHEKIDFTNYPSNEWEAATATQIFKDNTVLCNELNERLVQNFIHALESHSLEESKVPYLEFLQTICISDGHEIKKNQDMIISELMMSEIMHLHLDKIHIDELNSRMKTESSNSDKCNNILFNVNLIKLLICCTVGKNTFTEIKCHSFLSLEDIEKVITNEHCILQVKDIYIKFLYHCYIDTENETREIFTQSYIWSIFENFINDISLLVGERDCDEKCIDSLLRSYIANSVVDVLIGFFSHVQFNFIPNPQVSLMIILKKN